MRMSELPLARRVLMTATVLLGLASILGSAVPGSECFGFGCLVAARQPTPDSGTPTAAVLNVFNDGLGNGTFSTVPEGLVACREKCRATFALGIEVTLTATPDPAHTFGRWTGACTGTSPTVRLVLDVGKSCTATFGPGWQVASADAKDSNVSHLVTVSTLSTTGRLMVGYLQNLGGHARIGVLRESPDRLFVGLGDVNGNQTWSATQLDLALDAADQPVLAMLVNLNDIAVAHWDPNAGQAGQWDLVGRRINRGSAGRSPQIAVAGVPGQQTLIVAWEEAERIVVRRYAIATGTWDAAAVVPTTGNVRSVRMMLDAGGAPVIAYWSDTLNVIRETAPGVWTALGGAITNTPTDGTGAARFGVHVNAAGVVTVAWLEGISGFRPPGPSIRAASTAATGCRRYRAGRPG